MPPPTPLTVQTSAITRLLKEQDSYKTELAAQEMRLQDMRNGDGEGEEEEDDEEEEGNREWKVGQEVCGCKEGRGGHKG
jgi:tubulin-specific chaperone A